MPGIPELLAPAGNWDCARAAVENGADAIYFGLDRHNARLRADNFTEADLAPLMAFLHGRGVKGYLTLNTLVFPAELEGAEQYLRTVIRAGVDAAIIQDIGLCRLIRHLSADFPIHASTQMTITSAAGVAFARQLGCDLVVLARECSIQEINRIQAQLQTQPRPLPLEVFVHGALCVAYSGQCLTSEALGGRSANRGECAQACRMPYDLVVDGKTLDLGDRRYLLSPQDLCGLDQVGELIEAGVRSLKIEGRLKSPEYVASVTRVYRQALDRSSQAGPTPPSTASDRYELAMAFSRGLSSGWLSGIDNQKLVHGRFGKKRGVYLGQVSRITAEGVWLQPQAPLKPGDGVVFDQGNPAAAEAGGRIYQVTHHGDQVELQFGRRDLNLNRLRLGDRVWKTSDPALERDLRHTYDGDQPRFKRLLHLEVEGEPDQPMTVTARDRAGHIARVSSLSSLVAAHSQPLTAERLRQQLGRLGNSPFRLGTLENRLIGSVMLPVSELNQMRRSLVEQIQMQRRQPGRWQLHPQASLAQLQGLSDRPQIRQQPPTLTALVRDRHQLQAVVAAGLETIYYEAENPATYGDTVAWFRAHRRHPDQTLWVAPPRISKPLENYILDQVKRSQADGYLVRNYDHLAYFTDQPCRGDFSLNVANALTAEYLKHHYGLERLTASYDLNVDQLRDLLTSAPSHWFEVTLHQHMPLFHMEHCVFCAFLSQGKDFRDCGRPCESHQVYLRDRVGTAHLLQADAGCRNTLFNGVAQTGAEYVQSLIGWGAQYFRLEFLQESAQEVTEMIDQYQQLLAGEISGSQLWRRLNLQSQLGVTRGPLDSR
ncbi:MAG: peptidase U32 family protein [Nodosilinea sp.]